MKQSQWHGWILSCLSTKCSKHIICRTEKEHPFKNVNKIDDIARRMYSDNDEERSLSDISELFTDHKSVVFISNIKKYIKDAGSC